MNLRKDIVQIQTEHMQRVSMAMEISGKKFGDERLIPLVVELIREESREAIEALLNPNSSLEHKIKELCDLHVVTTNGFFALGVFDAIPLRNVDLNNLAKFGPGWSLREDGKYQPPPGFDKTAILKTIFND